MTQKDASRERLCIICWVHICVLSFSLKKSLLKSWVLWIFYDIFKWLSFLWFFLIQLLQIFVVGGLGWYQLLHHTQHESLSCCIFSLVICYIRCVYLFIYSMCPYYGAFRLVNYFLFRVYSQSLEKCLAWRRHSINTGLGKSRFTIVHMENDPIINNNIRINSTLCILTTLHLLLPHLVFLKEGKLEVRKQKEQACHSPNDSFPQVHPKTCFEDFYVSTLVNIF